MIAAGIIYTVIAIVTVASAWIIDLHRFDLWLSISRYVALRPWTAMLYFFCALMMALLVMSLNLMLKEARYMQKLNQVE